MVVRVYPPRPELQHIISRIMLFRYQLDPTEPRPINPFPPQPEHCLYFYPYDTVTSRNYAYQIFEKLPQSTFVGPQLSRVDLTMGFNMLVITVVFHPGGMYRLLGVPMHEMMTGAVDSTLLVGKEIDAITQRLRETTDFDHMIDIIQLYLLKKATRLKIALPIDLVLTEMIQKKSIVNIDQLAKLSCISTRQLERQFNERIGMPPKLFSRLVRFSHAWIMREKNPNLSWIKIAHTCDYADQMHMIRDFKEFAGVTPTLLQDDLQKSPLRLQADLTL
jgi:AraC-like DNA-binding protein